MKINQLVYYIGEGVQYEAIVRRVNEDGSVFLEVLMPEGIDTYLRWNIIAVLGDGEGQAHEIPENEGE